MATVPVGAPDSALRTRRYTSDTRQPIRESFVHGVAALCCLQQFLDREPCPAGLYQLGAEDSTRLGGGNRLPGAGNHSVQGLANQAATLADVLDVFARTLSGKPSQADRKIRWFDRLPAPTGGGGARVEFHRIEPPFSLSHPDAAAGTRRELDDLEPNLKRDINRALDEFGKPGEVDFLADIAPIVWEHAFRSKHFLDGD